MHTSLASRSDLSGVELVVWPDGELLRDQLARAGVPRLLLVGQSAPPPQSIAFDEDWIREPFDEVDLLARAQRLAWLVAQLADSDPWIDDERVLHRGPHTVMLTAAEAVVAGALLEASGEVVTRQELRARLQPGLVEPSGRAVDAVVYRLRRRVVGLGLSIRSSRGRGFSLPYQHPAV